MRARTTPWLALWAMSMSRSRSFSLKMPLAARLSTCSTPTMSSPCQSGTPMVDRIWAAMSDTEAPTSVLASAARTAARSLTTFLNTLRVTGMGSSVVPPRTRLPTATYCGVLLRPAPTSSSSARAMVMCVARERNWNTDSATASMTLSRSSAPLMRFCAW